MNFLAEREGFEPPSPFRVNLISSSIPPLPNHQPSAKTDIQTGHPIPVWLPVFVSRRHSFSDNSRTITAQAALSEARWIR